MAVPPKEQRVLTWWPQRSCWTKFYRGKRLYLGKVPGENDDRGYWQSVARWEEKKAQMDMEVALAAGEVPPAPPLTGITGAFARWDAGRATEQENAALGDTEVALTDYTALADPLPAVGGGASGETRIAVLIDTYLEEWRAKAEAGQRSFDTYREHADKLADWKGWCQKYRRAVVTQIDAPLLQGYRNAQLKLTGLPSTEGGISPYTARKRLVCLKGWLEWCLDMEVLTRLPRVATTRKFAAVDIPKPKPSFFTPDEVRTLFLHADRRMRCYMALALNAGYCQSDLATLDHDMLDLDADPPVIERTRHKTQRSEVPQVHRLWATTATLLRKEGTRGTTGLVLLTRDGEPLLRHKINEAGKMQKTNTVGRQFNRLLKAVGLNGTGRSFKHLRKSAANEIEQDGGFAPHVSSLFLAHAEQATKRFYVDRNFEELHRAVAWLEGRYKLADLLDKAPPAKPKKGKGVKK